MHIIKVCVACGKEHAIEIPEDGYMLWRAGKAHIQDAMPSVSAGDREMLLSGICPACWDEICSED